MITLLVITDGRPYLPKTLASAAENLKGPVTQTLIVDDSLNRNYHQWLKSTYPHATVYSSGEKLGFGGAISMGWDLLRTLMPPTPYVFHLEDDFTFNDVIPLEDLIYVLEQKPNLAQLALKRQAWSDREKAAGGVMEMHPEDYRNVVVGPHVYTAHWKYFTTNPSLYRSQIMELGWPNTQYSEGHFGFRAREAGYHFGYWGAKSDDPRVTHIGESRAGTGY